MMVIWTLALNTFREAVRDRVPHSIFFAVVTVCASLVLKDVTLATKTIVRSIAEGGIDVFASLIAMFLGISIFGKNSEEDGVPILSNQCPDGIEIGKYLGLNLTIWVEIVLLSSMYVLLMLFQQDVPSLIFFVSMGLLVMELMLLTAWATLFSTYSAPTPTAFTISIFTIGHLADDLWLLGSKSDSALWSRLFTSSTAVFQLEVLSIRELSVHERDVPWSQVGSMGYGVVYSAVVLMVAVVPSIEKTSVERFFRSDMLNPFVMFAGLLLSFWTMVGPF